MEEPLVLNEVRNIPELQKNLISVSGLDGEENQRTTLWHHKLRHLSKSSGMRILHSKNALTGMKNIQLDFCEGCVH
ncbi:hypothetical protein RJ640_013180 [Escallonia rubra]|uniref:GAG-pre-integrase domain-containing protein n=1 Tax=Escallonia rubra TaxID=112253 RepID=A0AA88UU59_9ASTE|nr:hypothetical protein RJ640_013180 [Escallonia rubra]